MPPCGNASFTLRSLAIQRKGFTPLFQFNPGGRKAVLMDFFPCVLACPAGPCFAGVKGHARPELHGVALFFPTQE